MPSTPIRYRAQYALAGQALTCPAPPFLWLYFASFRHEAPFDQDHPLLDHFLKVTSSNNPTW